MQLRSWREIRVMMKWKFPILTDSDFEVHTGDKEETLDRLASKIQKTREELKSLFDEIQKC